MTLDECVLRSKNTGGPRKSIIILTVFNEMQNDKDMKLTRNVSHDRSYLISGVARVSYVHITLALHQNHYNILGLRPSVLSQPQ